MDISVDEHRRAFGIWLRTGRWPKPAAPLVELKFNPWHDPEDGRFTFAGSGSYYPRGWRDGGFTGGGGGSFGGAGASGSWKPNQRRSTTLPESSGGTGAVFRVDVAPGASPIAPGRLAATPRSGKPKRAIVRSFREEVRNGYGFQIDNGDRTRQIAGDITLNLSQGRSRRAQREAGGSSRLSTDDGGHYIGRRFNGPKDAFNHFAQDASINRKRYKALEDEWERAKRRDEPVSVKIVPRYHGSSKRPYELDVWFSIDGIERSIKIPNGADEAENVGN